MFKVGDTWSYEWVIDKKLYKDFLALSNDRNPMHVNSRYAKSKGFKDKIIHGNILSCFISFFIGELLPIKDIVIISQSIKYKNEMYIDDNVKLNAVLSNYSISVNFV